VCPYSNGARGDTYGIEWSATCALSQRWRVTGQYTVFEMNLVEPATYFQDSDPKNQIYLRSSWDIGEKVEFDMIFRYVDALISLDVPSYITMDLRLAYRPKKHLELAVIGQNLLQPNHQEYSDSGIVYTTNVPRGVYGTVAWKY
jgi:iron complex outermembrane receptor protein